MTLPSGSMHSVAATRPARPTAAPAPALPPGPSLPAAVQTAEFLHHPTQLVARCLKRYGNPFRLRLLLWGDAVIVADPDGVRAIFKGKPADFHAGEAYELLRPVGGSRSLLLLDEDEHLRMRRLLLPPFHGDNLARHSDLITAITEREVAGWGVGRRLELWSRMESITLDVILRVVFGIRQPERADELRRLLPRLFNVSPALAPAFVMPRLRLDLGPLSPWGAFRRLRARIDELLYDEIRGRRAEAGVESRDDMLSQLLSLPGDGDEPTDKELRDALVTMLLAGHETTATALAWTFERLVRHPAVLGRLIDEVSTGDGAEYLDAVIKETLRVRPVVAHFGRKLTTDQEIDGYLLPAGTMVGASAYLVHRSADLYPDPDTFRPERFLDRQPEPYGWIPFGGGVRRCLGASFAVQEMKLVIAAVLRVVDLAPVKQAPERVRVRGVTLVPARGAKVVVRARH